MTMYNIYMYKCVPKINFYEKNRNATHLQKKAILLDCQIAMKKEKARFYIQISK